MWAQRFLAFFSLILISTTSLAEDVTRKGEYVGGAHVAGGVKFRAAAFLYRGTFDAKEIGAIVQKEMNTVASEDATIAKRWPGRKGVLPSVDDDPEAFTIRGDQIFVIAIRNEADGGLIWYAMQNATGDTYPTFNLLTNGGYTTKLNSSKRDGKIFPFGRGQDGRDVGRIGIATSAGWIGWSFDPNVR